MIAVNVVLLVLAAVVAWAGSARTRANHSADRPG